MNLLEKLKSYIQNPIESIACTLAGGILVYGFLIIIGVTFGWFHASNGNPDSLIYVFGLIYFFSGVAFLWSYFKRSVNPGAKLLYVFVAYLTIFFARISQAFYPVTWLAPLICAIVTAILYIWMSVNARS